MAQGHKGVTVTRRLWIRTPLEEIIYCLLIFSFLCSGNKARSLSLSGNLHVMSLKNWRIVGNGVF